MPGIRWMKACRTMSICESAGKNSSGARAVTGRIASRLLRARSLRSRSRRGGGLKTRSPLRPAASINIAARVIRSRSRRMRRDRIELFGKGALEARDAIELSKARVVTEERLQPR